MVPLASPLLLTEPWPTLWSKLVTGSAASCYLRLLCPRWLVAASRALRMARVSRRSLTDPRALCGTQAGPYLSQKGGVGARAVETIAFVALWLPLQLFQPLRGTGPRVAQMAWELQPLLTNPAASLSTPLFLPFTLRNTMGTAFAPSICQPHLYKLSPGLGLLGLAMLLASPRSFMRPNQSLPPRLEFCTPQRCGTTVSASLPACLAPPPPTAPPGPLCSAPRALIARSPPLIPFLAPQAPGPPPLARPLSPPAPRAILECTPPLWAPQRPPPASFA